MQRGIKSGMFLAADRTLAKQPDHEIALSRLLHDIQRRFPRTMVRAIMTCLAERESLLLAHSGPTHAEQ